MPKDYHNFVSRFDGELGTLSCSFFINKVVEKIFGQLWEDQKLNMEDLTKVIVAARYHLIHYYLLAYNRSRSSIKLINLWQPTTYDHKSRIQ